MNHLFKQDSPSQNGHKKRKHDAGFRPWKKTAAPRKVLAIRLQAMGDLVITLPYLQQLRNALPPDSQLDLLTRREVDGIPRSLYLFDRIYSIEGGRNTRKQALHACWLLPPLWLNHYDVVIDLQNNSISRLIRHSLSPAAWSSFDRYSPIPAGERVRNTIDAIGIKSDSAAPHFSLQHPDEANDLLLSAGWNSRNDLVVLNPAGAFESRNWPLSYYEEFIRLWLLSFPHTQFMLLGLGRIAEKAAKLKEKFGSGLIDLIDKTTPGQAFALVQRAKFVLSEDSGLMHMAWVSGIPTLALFGSTRSDWSRPLGDHTAFLDSSDLACGNCMKEICRFGDTRCLTRYSPGVVFEKALSLLS
ncbi:glycosyltransferase family 9 protein [Flavitalea flava]